MANKQKAQLKVAIYEEEIKELESQLKNYDEQLYTWRGRLSASAEDKELLNDSIRMIKKSLFWNKLSDEERQAKYLEDKTNKPLLDFTDEEGLKFCNLTEGIRNLLYSKFVSAGEEIKRYESLIFTTRLLIEKFKNKIEVEKNKDFRSADEIAKEAIEK